MSPAARPLAVLLTAAALAPALLGGLGGCSFREVRSGDPAFLEHELDWEPGVTTARQVAAALGPPDRIARIPGERLVFVYRFRRDVSTSFVLNAYLKLFSSDRVRRVDRTLLAIFDRADRLLFHGTSGTAP